MTSLCQDYFAVNKMPKESRKTRKRYCGIHYCKNWYGRMIRYATQSDTNKPYPLRVHVFQSRFNCSIPSPYNVEQRKLWLDAIATHQRTDTVTAGFVVCALHFDPADIQKNKHGKITCRPGGFPTIFPEKSGNNT